jgi:hypothetical protein
MRLLDRLVVISSTAGIARTRQRMKRKTTMGFAESQADEPLDEDLAVWEDEGGAASAPLPLRCSQVRLKWRLSI